MFNIEIEKTRTTNGDIALTTSGSTIVDFHMFASAYPFRSRVNELDNPVFWNALAADYDLTIRSILKSRDCRKGGKIKKIIPDFFELMRDASRVEKSTAEFILRCMLNKLPELGYWKEIVKFATETDPYFYEVRKYAVQLMVEYARNGEHKNLLFKYLPVKFNKGARFIAHGFGFTKEENWRNFVTPNRNTVETLVCTQNFAAIDYSKVPTMAMKLHTKAFKRFDNERLQAFYGELTRRIEAGESVEGMINAQGILPPDLIRDVRNASTTQQRDMFSMYGRRHNMAEVYKDVNPDNPDTVLINAQWAAMPRIDCGSESIMALLDTSGSMQSSVHGTGFACRDVAIAAAILASESNSGPFKDSLLAFSDEATFVEMQSDWTLAKKVAYLEQNTYCQSTNLMSAFDKILSIAQANMLPQSEIPTRLLVVSDMQFNGSFGHSDGMSTFEIAQRKFEEAGYVLPKIIYWDVAAGKSKPVAAFEQNVIMLSGFSEQNFSLVMSGAINPLQAILEELTDARYDWKLEE